MAKLRNQFYGLILPRGKLLRTAEVQLPSIFKGFAGRAEGGPSAELKVWRWPLDEAAKTHLVRRCEARHWSVDLFFESHKAMEGIKNILEGPQFRHVHLWLLSGPLSDYSVVYAQVLFLHLVRLLVGESQEVTSVPAIWDLLERAPLSEIVPEPPSKLPTPKYNTIFEALSAVEAEHSKDIVVTKDARESAEAYGNDGSQIQRTYMALASLGRITSLMRKERDKGSLGANLGQMLKQKGFSYEPKDADAKEAKLKAYCCGNELVCYEHIRLGSGHAQCVRIHFQVCPTCSRCVIQHCGDHL